MRPFHLCREVGFLAVSSSVPSHPLAMSIPLCLLSLSLETTSASIWAVLPPFMWEKRKCGWHPLLLFDTVAAWCLTACLAAVHTHTHKVCTGFTCDHILSGNILLEEQKRWLLLTVHMSNTTRPIMNNWNNVCRIWKLRETVWVLPGLSTHWECQIPTCASIRPHLHGFDCNSTWPSLHLCGYSQWGVKTEAIVMFCKSVGLKYTHVFQ